MERRSIVSSLATLSGQCNVHWAPINDSSRALMLHVTRLQVAVPTLLLLLWTCGRNVYVGCRVNSGYLKYFTVLWFVHSSELCSVWIDAKIGEASSLTHETYCWDELLITRFCTISCTIFQLTQRRQRGIGDRRRIQTPAKLELLQLSCCAI